MLFQKRVATFLVAVVLICMLLLHLFGDPLIFDDNTPHLLRKIESEKEPSAHLARISRYEETEDSNEQVNQQNLEDKNQEKEKWVERDTSGPRDALNNTDSVSLQVLENGIMEDLNPTLTHLDASLPNAEPISVSFELGYRPKSKFFLTLCTMIKNDVPYIVEWIEFLRFQGVDRFMLYDDRSADNLKMLNQFYRERDPDAHVYVIDAPNVSKFERLNHVVADCFKKYGNDTEWMMIADTDEFIHSPYYGTIKNLTKKASEMERIRGHPIDALTAECSTFGTSGRINRFQYRLVLDKKGKVQYVNDCGLQLMIDKVLRGPDERRNSSEKPLRDKLMSTIEVCRRGGDSKGCDQTPGKSIFRPAAVEVPDVHSPNRMKPGHFFPQHNRANLFEGRGDLPETQVFACNHFYKRSYQDAYLKAFQWGMWQHMETFNHTNTAVYGTVKDDNVRRTWYEKMEKRMRELSILRSDSDPERDPICQ